MRRTLVGSQVIHDPCLRPHLNPIDAEYIPDDLPKRLEGLVMVAANSMLTLKFGEHARMQFADGDNARGHPVVDLDTAT